MKLKSENRQVFTLRISPAELSWLRAAIEFSLVLHSGSDLTMQKRFIATLNNQTTDN